jgi:hypothetical protein
MRPKGVPGDYLTPDALTFDVAASIPSLRVRCDGDVRASLAGDTSDVIAVRFARGRRSRSDLTLPGPRAWFSEWS